MKNISIGIQALMAIAIVVLYILYFTQNSSTKASTEKEAKVIAEEAPQEEDKSQDQADLPNFAYINSDTLLKKYEYYQKIQKQLENRRASLEATFKNRQTNLQNEVMNFQKSISEGTINEQTARQTQQDLMQKEQNLIKEGQQQESYLIKEEQNLSKELNEKIAKFLEQFAEKNGYEMIFSFSRNTMAVGIMHANPELNVTEQVIIELNEAYKAEQK